MQVLSSIVLNYFGWLLGVSGAVVGKKKKMKNWIWIKKFIEVKNEEKKFF